MSPRSLSIFVFALACLTGCSSDPQKPTPDSGVDSGLVDMGTDDAAQLADQSSGSDLGGEDLGTDPDDIGVDATSDGGTDMASADVGADMALPDPPMPQPWSAVSCAGPTGADDRVGMTTDEGMTMAPAMQNIPEEGYGAGLATTGAADTMYLFSLHLYRSIDAGCTWTMIPSTVDADYIAGSRFEDRVYLASAYVSTVWRVDAGVVTELQAPTSEQVRFIGPSRLLSDRVFLSDAEQLYRSDDAGVTWQPAGVAPLTQYPNLGFCGGIIVDPEDDNHLFAKCSGGLVSFDGGMTWDIVNGYQNHQFANVLFTSIQGDVVWVYGSDGLDLQFMRSLDGGRSFDVVTSNTLRAQGIWGHPTNNEKVYYVNTSELCNFDITRGTEQCYETTAPLFLDIDNIVFHPDDPSRIYVGWNLEGPMN